MSDLPEQAAPAPTTRRQRRAEAQAAHWTRRVAPPRPLTVIGTVAFAALIALTGFADPRLVAASITLAGLVLAWGWPTLLSLPSPRGTTAVLAIGTVLMAGSVVATRTDPFLAWVPAALAVAVVVAFLHQLMRRDGRPRLTASVAATVCGLAIVSSGVALVPLPNVRTGSAALAAAMAGLAVGALADPLVGSKRLRQWALFIGMLAGGAAAIVVSVVAGHPQAGPAALLGVMAAGVAHACRRMMAVLPSTVSARAQLAVAASSTMLVGVVAYVVVRRFVA